MAEKVGFDFDGAILGQLETNGGAPIPFLEFLFDGQEKVVGLFLVNIELAVAGDAGGPGTVNLHPRKYFADKMANQFGKKNELPRVASVFGQGNKARDAARDLHESVAGGFLITRFRKKDDEVDRFVQELREGVAGIDGEGSEDGKNISLKNLPGPFDLNVVELGNRAKVKPLMGKGWKESFVEELVLVGDHAKDAGTNRGEDIGRAEAIGSVHVASVFDELLEGGDTDFKELIEIGADDGEEFESFEEGLGGVLGLLEDTMIEFEPAKLAIQVRG